MRGVASEEDTEGAAHERTRLSCRICIQGKAGPALSLPEGYHTINGSRALLSPIYTDLWNGIGASGLPGSSDTLRSLKDGVDPHTHTPELCLLHTYPALRLLDNTAR